MTAVHLERWTVTSGSNANSRAAVVIRGGSHDWKASAEGNGPVDALYRAVDRALSDLLDGGHPQLLGYDVHALEAGPSAEGRVTVVIAPPASSPDHRQAGRFTAEVSSTNTIQASVEAYIQAVNDMLATEPWVGAAAAAAEVAAERRVLKRGGTAEAGGAEWDDDAREIDVNEWFNT